MTLAGRCHAHNVGASLMSAVGGLAAEWVAHSEDEYRELAVAAAADLTVSPCLRALNGAVRERAPVRDRPSIRGRAPGRFQW